MAQQSQVLGFLIILKDSFKLFLKNVKFMAPITLLSLLLSSILMIIFVYIFQTLNDYIFKTPQSDSSILLTIAYLSLTLFEIICIIASAKISQISGIATILVSASDTTNISPQNLYSRIKTTVRRSTLRRSSLNGGGLGIFFVIVLMLVIFMAIFSPNAFTISIAVVVGISVLVFQLHASVATGLSRVVSVVEEKFEGSEALEKAQQLIQGQQQGFIINLFLYSLALIIILGFWFVSFSVNLMELGLCLVVVLSLANIYWCVAYTVFYFECNKYHGGDFDYSILPAAASNLA